MPVSLVQQQAVHMLNLHEKLICLWNSDGRPPQALDDALEAILRLAEAADEEFVAMSTMMAGATYRDLHSFIWPALEYSAIWEQHLNLVAPHLTRKEMKSLRGAAQRNLGVCARKLWRSAPPFLNDYPLSSYCGRLGGSARSGSRRAVKKHAKRQMRCLKVLIIALSASTSPLRNDAFKRSISLSAGNAVQFKGFRR